MHEMQETGRNKGRSGSNNEKRHESNKRHLPGLRHQSLPHPREEMMGKGIIICKNIHNEV